MLRPVAFGWGFLLSCLVAVPPLVPVAQADSSTIDSTLTIETYKGPPFQVEYVGPWGMGSFRFRTVGGEIGYLTPNRIHAMKDAKGKDRFPEMFRNRSSFGVFAPDAHSAPRSYTAWITRPFQQTPERRRRSYLVLGFGSAARASEVKHSGDDGSLFLAEIGGIRTLSPRWGVGGVVQFTSTSDDYRTVALGVRVRRYLSDLWTLETTQGLYQDFEDGVENRGGVPYFGEVAVSAGGAISLFTRVERHKFRTWQRTFLYYTEEIEGTDTAIHFGFRLGPRPGYLTVPAAAIASLGLLFALGSESQQ